jgi:hypothetical protein
MKPLPVGVQSFEKLRKDGNVYVDKTKEIHRLITSGNIYFLSRPRRFGKSLLVSTIAEIFKGDKSLFEGLYIYDKYDWTQQYPVITIDWSNVKLATAEEMENDMCKFLEQIADSDQIKLLRDYASSKFAELIQRLNEKTGRQVVVLVDEYDMPILDALNNTDEMELIRNFLQSFYKVLKGTDEHLRFVFITGVSKFAKVSIFSGMNSPDDITIDDQYATICGYTQDELTANFEEYIHEFALKTKATAEEVIEAIRNWYNGYSWDGITTVYNPFSTLLLFRKKKFTDYWFSSGTPTFLINQIKKRNDVKYLLEPVTIAADGFDNFEVNTIDTKLLLFQTGYLTIKKVAKSMFGQQMNYTLGIPNEEVRQSLMQHLVSSYAECTVTEATNMREVMLQQMFDGDVTSFEQNLKTMFARIPYQLHISCDAYYHSLILLWLNMLGFEPLGEVLTNIGRIDVIWKFEDRVVIAEVKHDENKTSEALLQEAFKQIHDQRYYEGFTGDNRRIALLAIAVAGREVTCKMEELGG